MNDGSNPDDAKTNGAMVPRGLDQGHAYLDDFGRLPTNWRNTGGAPVIVEGHIDWARQLRGLIRHKWLILVATLLGVGAAAVAYRLYPEKYVAYGTIWVHLQDAQESDRGPITTTGLFGPSGWLELMSSYAVLDPVVEDLKLQVVSMGTEQEEILEGIVLEGDYEPGIYVLQVDATGQGFTLFDTDGEDLVSGVAGDTIHSTTGFYWAPDMELVGPGEEVAFFLMSTRDAADNLNNQMRTSMDAQGSFIELSLEGNEPEKQASIINAMMDEFVVLADELKSGQLDETAAILRDQMERTGGELSASERALESFRVQTITLPSERGTVVTPGLESTRDPAFNSFFGLKERTAEISYDRERLQRATDQIATSGVLSESFEAIPSASNSTQLTAVLNDLATKRQELRNQRLRYTDEHPPVARLIEEIRIIEFETVPAISRLLIAELTQEEAAINAQLSSAATELAQIPPRSIEEARLSRNVGIADALYTELRQRYEVAALAAASTAPAVRILDRSVAPEMPTTDGRMLFSIILAMSGLGLGVVLGLVIERLDPRLRDAGDITTDLGLPLLGAIPNLPSGSSKKAQQGRMSVLEAFRGLRLNTSYAFGAAGPVLVSVTSPAPQEGKTTVSVNLALAFAEEGKRTLLIDADTRRGDLHEPFQIGRNPGLVNYLSDTNGKDEVVRSVRENLDVVPSGERSARSPELLNSARMMDLVAAAKGDYDVVIIDCPPLGAGSDALLLGTLAGSMILVLRSGQTDLPYAEAMTDPLRRLPVRMLGAVLNDVRPGFASGPTRYYANYLPGYEAADELVQIG